MTDDMRARLEQLATGELLRVLQDRDLDEWRPEAFPLIEAILAERHVDVPAALESLRAAATYVDFEALVEVATFSTSVDAHLCRMALEEAEIPMLDLQRSPRGSARSPGHGDRGERARPARRCGGGA